MGLEIYAVNSARKFSGVSDDWNTRTIYLNDAFPEHATEFEDGCYEFEEVAAPDTGYSYSLYSRWRSELAEMAGYTGKQTDPFYWLIHFSDCEGVIGTAASAKLHEDFRAFETNARARSRDFLDVYKDFAMCFEHAAKGGFVEFH